MFCKDGIYYLSIIRKEIELPQLKFAYFKQEQKVSLWQAEVLNSGLPVETIDINQVIVQ